MVSGELDFWTDGETAYCSLCGFGSSQGPRLNGKIKSRLAVCRGCLSPYFKEESKKKEQVNGHDINSTRSANGKSGANNRIPANYTWKSISLKQLKELQSRYKVTQF